MKWTYEYAIVPPAGVKHKCEYRHFSQRFATFVRAAFRRRERLQEEWETPAASSTTVHKGRWTARVCSSGPVFAGSKVGCLAWNRKDSSTVSPREICKLISEEKHLPNFLDNKGRLEDSSDCMPNMKMGKISWDRSYKEFWRFNSHEGS